MDFAGGWLDVPEHGTRWGGYVVNCAIEPMVSLTEFPYQTGSGLGTSAAWSMLNGRDALADELGKGVGWQDPAIIREGGCCVWMAGKVPVLWEKVGVDWLRGKLGLYWTGKSRKAADMAGRARDYTRIRLASMLAVTAVAQRRVGLLKEAVQLSYHIQRDEGMDVLPPVRGAVGKYAGAGWGGYGVYVFESVEDRNKSGLLCVEPYMP